jgi:DNA helicase HerA-like ATPase
MPLPVLKGKYRPAQYVKVKERLLLPSKLKRGDNFIITRNEDRLDENSLILLGKVLEHTSSPDYFALNVWLDVSYPYVMLIPGRRGTGKSYTLGVLAEGLSLSREESNITTKKTKQTVVIIDTLGQFWQMKYAPKDGDEEEQKQLELLNAWGLEPHGIQHIQVYVPYGKKVNPEWREFQIEFSEIELEELAGALNLDVYQDRMGQLLNHVFNRVREEGYTKTRIDENTGELKVFGKVLPKTDYGIQDFIDCIDTDIDIISQQTGYHIQTRRALRSRLHDMQRWKIFFKEGTRISEIYKKGYLTVVNLEGVGEDFRNLVVGVLARKIFQARETTRRKEKIGEISGTSSLTSEDVPPGWLIIDEAHEYCPSIGTTASRNILIKFAKEGRSLGLGLIMATQQPYALSQKISSQCELVISHALAFMTDIRALVDRLVNRMVQEYQRRTETYSFEEQIRLLKPGTAILSTMGVSRIFLVIIRPRLTIHGGKVPKME